MLPVTLRSTWPALWRDAMPILAAGAVVAVAVFGLGLRLASTHMVGLQVALVVLAALIMLSRGRPGRMVALVALAFIVADLAALPGYTRLDIARSFFGVHQVLESHDGRTRVLLHGTTNHGAELVRDSDGNQLAGRPVPLTYYYLGGPMSQAVEAARAAQGGQLRAGVVGLGTASLACHRREGETWTFFEIDPEVVRIARDPRLFRFLSKCAPASPIVVGDARLTLAASAQSFDLIVIDAFSSDAIPVHLLTREAVAQYLAKLSPRGMIVMHISNRHMELASVVAAVGNAEGLVTAFKRQRPDASAPELSAGSAVAVLARQEADFGDLLTRQGWQRIEAQAAVPAWTDDYSDLLSAIMRMKFAR
jgi:spermidine synthase